MLSTRRLAAELRVSRTIVLDAFDQLLAEGFIEARTGSGTFVASGAAFSPREPAGLSARYAPSASGLSTRASIDFRSGLPDLARFPVGDVAEAEPGGVGQPHAAGSLLRPAGGRPELRAEIARYVAAYRGVRCHPEQIIITGGTTQAVGIVSRLLLRGSRPTCILEDPVTSDIQRIRAASGGRSFPCEWTGRAWTWMRCLPAPGPVSSMSPPRTSSPWG